MAPFSFHKLHRGCISIEIDLLLQFPYIHDAPKQEVLAKTAHPLLKYCGHGRHGLYAKMSLRLWVSAAAASGLLLVNCSFHLAFVASNKYLSSLLYLPKDFLFLGKRGSDLGTEI